MKISVNIEEVAQGAAYLKQKSSQYQQMIDQIYARMHPFFYSSGSIYIFNEKIRVPMRTTAS